MSDEATYKIGKGRGTKTVQARQYTRDQDFGLLQFIDGPARVYRDHIRVGTDEDEQRAEKGDWLVKFDNGEVRVMKPHAWTIAAPRRQEA
jgi:hypothetical protein